MQHFPLAFCLLVVGVGAALAQDGPAPTVAAGTRAASVTVDAFTAPCRQLEIASQMGGVVTEVMVEEGDRVSAGQELMRLNDDLLRAQLAVSEARKQSSLHQITAARARHEMLEKVYEREVELFNKDISSQADLDKARLDRDLAALSIENAQNDLKIATLSAERDRVAVEQTVIRAPGEGEVFRIEVRAGEAVEPLRPVLRSVTVDPLDVVAYVPIDTVGRIRAGMAASLRLENVPGGPLPCTVTVVDLVADPASGTYRVKAALPNADRRIAAGARGSLTLNLTD